MNKQQLVGLVSVSNTVTISVINRTTHQIAIIKHFDSRQQLASKIYSTLFGTNVEEIYMGFDTQTVSWYNESAYGLSTFTVGNLSKHSVISMKDLEIIKGIGQTLKVNTIKIFDYITMFKALANDRDAIILQNDEFGVKAVQVSRGNIQDYRLGATTNTVKSMVQLSNAEMLKLLNVDFASKFGRELINFDALSVPYKVALVPVLFMMYTPECLDLNPWDSLPQPKPTIAKNRYNEPTFKAVENPNEEKISYSVKNDNSQQRKVLEPVEDYDNLSDFDDEVENKKDPLVLRILSKTATILTGVVLGVSLACTTQLSKQNIILLDALQSTAAASTNLEQTSSYYNRLIEGFTNAEKSNSAILSKVNAITTGGTIAEYTLKKNSLEVIILSNNEEEASKFKAELAKVVNVVEMTASGTVNSGDISLNKYKITCSIK